MNFPPAFCFSARAGENFMQKRKTQTPTKLQWSVENLRSTLVNKIFTGMCNKRNNTHPANRRILFHFIYIVGIFSLLFFFGWQVQTHFSSSVRNGRELILI